MLLECRPLTAFLVRRSDDFGIVCALALAGRPRLTGRSPSRRRRALGAFVCRLNLVAYGNFVINAGFTFFAFRGFC
jgi:hypothetical protein